MVQGFDEVPLGIPCLTRRGRTGVDITVFTVHDFEREDYALWFCRCCSVTGKSYLAILKEGLKDI